MQGRTTLVIAHRLSTVRALDRLLVFDHGRIVEEGDHASLVQRKNGIYRGCSSASAGTDQGIGRRDMRARAGGGAPAPLKLIRLATIHCR